MTDEELRKLRKEKGMLIHERDKYVSLLNEKKLLEHNDAVKRYFELDKKLNDFKRDYKNETRKTIVDRLADHCRITSTNDIYVYMGTYMYNYMDDIEHGSTDYRVNKNDKHANYSLYRNLENEEYVKILISERAVFEEEHIIITGKKTIINEKYYYELRRRFISDCINHGEQYAIDILSNDEENKVKKLNKKCCK